MVQTIFLPIFYYKSSEITISLHHIPINLPEHI